MEIEITRIGVVGAGIMGRGIVHLVALHGYQAVLVDREEAILEQAVARLRERIPEELRELVAGRIATATDLAAVGECDLVMEVVNEELPLKRQVLADISRVVRRDALIATNTSGLSIDTLSCALTEPGRFIGMHFMNPPTRMELVEVVRGEATAPATVEAISDLARRLGKVPVVVRDAPGFVANRLLFALIGEAFRILENGIAGKEEIDTVMRFGLNHPMGPFQVADLIGLDVCLQIMRHLYESLGEPCYRPPGLLEALVREGKLGRKSGEGFYRYG